ncbi:LolA family protein [Halobiforma nitratireducens]|uniref:Outer membrane lipoprotein carrier protein LolA n=1 Tax=Halobiforma nitratireducens JCM 10879 TaxID=1227454 RepID=M0MJN9_9EURY|nr:hypothetical protein [Halobiforma nitratireducens]EMA44660.1 hypothetical protein C446_02882 [Halobiforma nitratireducens JCM 10879]
MSPTFDRRRLALPLLVLVLAVLVAGCVAIPTADEPRELADRLADVEPPDEIDATLEVRHEIDGETTTSVEDVQFRTDGALRIEPGGDDARPLVVSDGQQRWQYDHETNAVHRMELDPDAPSFLDGVYAQQEEYVDRYELEEFEETTIEGRDAYRVAFDPPADEPIDRSVSVLIGETEYVIPIERDGDSEDELTAGDRTAETVEVWVDEQHLFPIKHRVAGDGVALETTYSDLEFEPGIPDDRFAFEPPSEEPNGTEGGDGDGESEGGDEDVIDVSFPSITYHETIDEADDAVPFPIAEPPAETLPETVALDTVRTDEYPDENREHAQLAYRGNGTTVLVTTSDGPGLLLADGDDVQVGDTEGTIADTPEGTELDWRCEDGETELYHSVFVGDEVDDHRALALEIGEEIGC